MKRRLFGFALALALLLSLATYRQVIAHAFLLRSDPEDGAVLAEFPREVRLWFSEAVVADFTRVELINSAGQTMPITNVRVDVADATLVTIELPEHPPNAYRLTWHTLSADDVHPGTGTVVFGVQQSAALATTAAPPPPFAEVLWRWANFAGLSGLLGPLALILVVLPATTELDSASVTLYQTTRRKLLWLALWGGLAALLSGLGLAWAQAQTISGAEPMATILKTTVQLLTETAYGSRWWQRQGLLVELVIAVGVLLHGSTARFNQRAIEFVVFGPFALLLVITQASNGHAAGAPDVTPLPIVVEALHLLAAAIWSGGLLALVISIAPLLWHNLETSSWAWMVLRRFGGLATACVAVLAVTGLYTVGQQVASLDALLATGYGQTLLIKAGVVGGVGLVGLLNSAMLHPRVARLLRRIFFQPVNWKPFSSTYLRQTVTAEALGLGALLLAAAWLGATPPARGPEFDPPPTDILQTSFTTQADDLLITLSIRPNRPGQNFITLGVFNTRRPIPAPIERVAVQLQPPDQIALSLIAEPQSAEGQYQIVGDVINAAGQWPISVTVQRPGLDDATTATVWTVLPTLPSARRPVVISNRPLTGWANALALGVGIGFGVAVVWWRRTKRKPKLAQPVAASTPSPTPDG